MRVVFETKELTRSVKPCSGTSLLAQCSSRKVLFSFRTSARVLAPRSPSFCLSTLNEVSDLFCFRPKRASLMPGPNFDEASLDASPDQSSSMSVRLSESNRESARQVSSVISPGSAVCDMSRHRVLLFDVSALTILRNWDSSRYSIALMVRCEGVMPPAMALVNLSRPLVRMLWLMSRSSSRG